MRKIISEIFEFYGAACALSVAVIMCGFFGILSDDVAMVAVGVIIFGLPVCVLTEVLIVTAKLAWRKWMARA